MIIAIPSVTRYISDSRKASYISTAKENITGARNKVNDGKLGMFDTDATYYIPASYIKTENANKSPYGEFTEAYVVVIYNGKGYKYFWTSVDDTGEGIKGIIAYDNLENDNVESDITDDMIDPNITKTGVGERSKILVLDPETETWREVVGGATTHVSEEGGEVTQTTASTILAEYMEGSQLKADAPLNQIPDTNIYIFKGGTANPPANYVKFNCSNPSDTSTCEDWRIIGIYNGQMKIIRVGSNGQPTAPTAPTGFTSIKLNTTTPNPGWANSSLKESLNTTYYNTLSDTAKGMIDKNGSWDVGPAAYNAIASGAYTSATTSGTVVGSTTHTTPWTGKVGLMALYEFLYATGGGDTCLTTSGNDYDLGCGTAANDWLLNTGSTFWIISPSSDYVGYALNVTNGGYVRNSYVDNDYAAVPAVFLKREVKITKGDGTSENPYELSL